MRLPYGRYFNILGNNAVNFRQGSQVFQGDFMYEYSPCIKKCVGSQIGVGCRHAGLLCYGGRSCDQFSLFCKRYLHILRQRYRILCCLHSFALQRTVAVAANKLCFQRELNPLHQQYSCIRYIILLYIRSLNIVLIQQCTL